MILVTGGAGYIGSHVVKHLGEAGRELIVLDNLSKGFRSSVLYGKLIVGDTGDYELVKYILRKYDVSAILHFAAHTVVPDSVKDPLSYYGNNTESTRVLLLAAQACGVKHFIFSSTAAVYGLVQGVAFESTPTQPINPYGRSKLMSEYMLRDLAAAGGPSFAILRYFNVAGCDSEGRIGQSTENSTLLIKAACEVALGKRSHLSIFGSDYPTPDGTCIRDYIHVEDLANAHLLALKYLESGGESTTLNCGYGRGHSVREVVEAVELATGRLLPTVELGRRAGDPPRVIAGADLIKEKLGWSPQYDSLDLIVSTSLAWES